MKKILILSFLIFLPHAFAGVAIISDLDDTIKITNSGNEIDATVNGIFSNDVFTGMSEFFEATELYANGLYVLSASPSFIRPKILSTLKKKQIQIKSLTLRNSLNQPVLEYKVAEMKNFLDGSSDDFILIGDDVGQDPEAYETIAKLYPGRILAIYIHVVKGRKIPVSSSKYWSTFDLFMAEFMAKRMSTSWVEKGAELILKESNMKLIFPKFAHCPTATTIWAWQVRTIFAEEARSVMDKLVRYCQSRQSTI